MSTTPTDKVTQRERGMLPAFDPNPSAKLASELNRGMHNFRTGRGPDAAEPSADQPDEEAWS